MMKIVGFGLLGLFALMVLPPTIADETNPMFYGTATMVLADPDGNPLLTQTVHNRITDEGENYIVRQVFDVGTAGNGDQDRVGAICIIENSDSVFSESATDATVNNLTPGAGNICHATLAMSNTGSTSDSEGEVFTAGTDFSAGETISGILICGKNSDDNDFATCATPTNSVALAAIDLANVTVSGTDTITITYTFDITTAGS